MQIVFLGGSGTLSGTVFTELVSAGLPPRAVYLHGFAPSPRRPRRLPVAQPHNPWPALTGDSGVRLGYLGGRPASLPNREPRPDLVVTACYPYKLPTSVWRWPRLACLNVHPSLLPAYRGPAPLFWQLYHGEARTGVSVHRVTEILDGGDIVAQREIALADDSSMAEIEVLLGRHGAAMLAELTPRLARGSVRYRRQSRSTASRQPAPVAADRRVDTGWPTRHARNFVNAVATDSRPVALTFRGRKWLVGRAAPPRGAVGMLVVEFADGALELEVTRARTIPKA